jgi:[citrate (pro-3S)-lyase] ligase
MMQELLPAHGDGSRPVLVHELPRLEAEGAPVSASKVRALIRSGDLEGVRPLVPDSTWSWLTSPEAVPVLERIRASDSRH